MKCRLAFAILLLGLASTGRAEPVFEKVDLFEAGKDGYALYRIPGIVVARSGVVLAYCEARKNAGGDWGRIDLMLRRSTDNGKTWEPRRHLVQFDQMFERNPVAVKQKLGKEGETTLNNPVAIADAKTGAVHFLVCVEYARCFYLRTDDDGKTFTKPVEITATFDKFKSEYDWKVLATGPGHGIQLASGRLIVPIWLSTGTGGHAHRPSCVASIYSDDHGKTWQRGDIVVRDPDLANPSETVAVELTDGTVMFNIRHEGKQQRRAVSISPDGATKWSKPTFDDALPEPVCMASLIRLSKGILFVNPDNPTGRERKNVSARLSTDDGRTWASAKSIEPGPSGYSDLAVAGDGTVLCFYERGAMEKTRPRWLTVARFNRDWLQAPSK
jgi:sialidase-1